MSVTLSFLWNLGEVQKFGNNPKKQNCVQKLRASGTQGMPSTIRSRIFCLPFFIRKYKLKSIQYYNFACSVWLCNWYLMMRKNRGWGCWRNGCCDNILAYVGRDNRVVEENAHCVASWTVLFTKYCTGDRIKQNEMGEARDTYGRKEKCLSVWWRNMR